MASFRLAGYWREALYCCTFIFTIETFRIFTLVEITSYVTQNGGSQCWVLTIFKEKCHYLYVYINYY